MSIQTKLGATKVVGTLTINDDSIATSKITGLDTTLSSINSSISTVESNIATLQTSSSSITGTSLALDASSSIIDHATASEGTIMYEENLKSFRQYNGTYWQSMSVIDYSALSLEWTQVGSKITGSTSGDKFGNTVAISANGRIVAASSINDNNVTTKYVRVYQWDGTNWTQLGSDITSTYLFFGFSLDLNDDGTILAIGAIGLNNNEEGHVLVYKYDNSNGWEQLGSTFSDSAKPQNRLGQSVSLSADGYTLAIADPLNDTNGNNSGRVQIFEYDSVTTSDWQQIGSDIVTPGFSVSLNAYGTIVAIGVTGSNSNTGHVEIHKLIDGSWVRLGSNLNGNIANDYMGTAVSLNNDGSIVAISAKQKWAASHYFKVYKWNGTTWLQLGDTITSSEVGLTISISSDGAIVAAGGESNDGHVYYWNGSAWILLGSKITNSGEFGRTMSISADGATVAIGARTSSANFGDVYTFSIVAPAP